MEATTKIHAKHIPLLLFSGIQLAAALLCLNTLLLVSAQETGFISLDCGAHYAGTYADNNGILWSPDDQDSIHVGLKAQIQNAPQSLALPFTTIRYFPASGNVAKYCYVLPLTAPGVDYYLVRATFVYGNYSNKLKQLPISFDILLDVNKWGTVNLTQQQPQDSLEVYVPAKFNTSISVCLARSGEDDPFISTLELRPLSNKLFSVALLSNQHYFLLSHRVNYGAVSPSPIRYPADPFDRIWVADTTPPSFGTGKPVDVGDLADQPPSEVLKTAIGVQAPRESLYLNLKALAGTYSYSIALYFSEIDGNVTSDGERVFYINLDGERYLNNAVDIFNGSRDRLYNAYEIYSTAPRKVESTFSFTLTPAEGSKLGPLLNAIEILRLSDTALLEGTHQEDIAALEDVKMKLNLSQWTGDPCFPASSKYDWVECNFATPPRITSLMLSHRNCSGSLSPSINLLTELTQISLDNNQLLGSIPKLTSLVKLQKLDLQNNYLTGPIPESLATLSSLNELFLQNNHLSGQIPPNLLQKSENSLLNFKYDGNPDLCSGAIEHCPANVPSSFSSEISRGGKNNYMVALVVVCAVVGLAGVCIVLCCVIERRQKLEATPAETHSANIEDVIYDRWEDQEGSINAPTLVNYFTYDQIRVATNYFNNKIGQGAFGAVFHGLLGNDHHVAVKVLSRDSRQGVREFSNEVFLLSRVYHKNLVSLIGYSNDPECILVYEYMAKGTLRDHLYGPLSSHGSLTWRERLEIALDAAQGLEYLHWSCDPTIIHRDVKSSNILLNDKMQAKVADFGLSKVKRQDGMTHVSTAIMGTPGYLDPEYSATSQLTDKSDVYSFGIVLLEIVCGRAPLDTTLPESQFITITDWVWSLLQQGDIDKVADPRLDRNYGVESLWKVVEVAMKSTQSQRKDRPSMSEVVAELKEAKRIELGTSSFAPPNECSSFANEFSGLSPR